MRSHRRWRRPTAEQVFGTAPASQPICDPRSNDPWVVFPPMVDVVPEGARGRARIRHGEHGHWDCLDGPPPPPGHRIARLYVDDQIMMSDSTAERQDALKVVRAAHGRVLVGGLGLGMILHPTALKPEVSSVTVLEVERDVIDLVGPTVPPTVRIEEADVFGWRPPRGETFNTIYFDIWPDASPEVMPRVLEDVAYLRRRAGEWTDPTDPAAWIACWAEDALTEEELERRGRELAATRRNEPKEGPLRRTIV